MNVVDEKYLSLVDKVLSEGVDKDDRTGVGTRSIFGYQTRFPLSYRNFPILTVKHIVFDSLLHELLWFISGSTNINYLKENDVNIWNQWASESGEVGPVYGYQWRSWPSPDGEKVDQLKNVISGLRENPDSRRHLVSAWNPGMIERMALPPCFPEGVLVKTYGGYREIQNIKEGDMVLSEDGTYQEVKNKFKTEYKGSLVEIDVSYTPDFKSTPNHPFLTNEGWKKASEINSGDWLCISQNQKSKQPVFESKKFKYYNRWDDEYFYENEKNGLSEEEAWMLGYFTGDGWVNHNKEKDSSKINRCYFSINDEKNEEIKSRLEKILGNKLLDVQKSGKSTKYETTSSKWGEVFRRIGQGARSKQVLNEIFNAPKNIIEAFLEGYEEADGCRGYGYIMYTTVSKKLAYGIQKLYAKLGKVAMISEQNRPSKGVIEGREVNVSNTYLIKVRENREHELSSFKIEEDKIWLKVNDVSLKSNSDDYVYNLSVENTNTYTVNNINTHNCHFAFQFYSKPLSYEERRDVFLEWHEGTHRERQPMNEDTLDEYDIPERELTCKISLRSNDIFIGAPFNISSYSLLTILVAKLTDHVPGELVYSIGDAHIYQNHYEQCVEIMNNRSYELPSLKVNDEVEDVDYYSSDDIDLVDYNSNEFLKAPVAT